MSLQPSTTLHIPDMTRYYLQHVETAAKYIPICNTCFPMFPLVDHPLQPGVGQRVACRSCGTLEKVPSSLEIDVVVNRDVLEQRPGMSMDFHGGCIQAISWGFHGHRGYPKMDGLQWKILWKMDDWGYPHVLGNLCCCWNFDLLNGFPEKCKLASTSMDHLGNGLQGIKIRPVLVDSEALLYGVIWYLVSCLSPLFSLDQILQRSLHVWVPPFNS